MTSRRTQEAHCDEGIRDKRVFGENGTSATSKVCTRLASSASEQHMNTQAASNHTTQIFFLFGRRRVTRFFRIPSRNFLHSLVVGRGAPCLRNVCLAFLTRRYHQSSHHLGNVACPRTATGTVWNQCYGQNLERGLMGALPDRVHHWTDELYFPSCCSLWFVLNDDWTPKSPYWVLNGLCFTSSLKVWRRGNSAAHFHTALRVAIPSLFYWCCSQNQ